MSSGNDKEVLSCKDCKKDWLRDVKRGRKPVRCPECDSNNDDSLEELTCEDCGDKWHRVVKGGRKPKTCPVCDGVVEEPEEEPEPEPEEKDDTETLTCQTCDKDWEREPKPGRKPKTCPECKKNPPKKKKKKTSKSSTSKKKKKKKDKKDFDTFGDVVDQINPIGEAEEVRCNDYKRYSAFELFDGEIRVKEGAILTCVEGKSSTYKFKALVLRPDGTGYCDVTGISDKYYANKYRALGLDVLTV